MVVSVVVWEMGTGQTRINLCQLGKKSLACWNKEPNGALNKVSSSTHSSEKKVAAAVRKTDDLLLFSIFMAG